MIEKYLSPADAVVKEADLRISLDRTGVDAGRHTSIMDFPRDETAEAAVADKLRTSADP